MESNLILTVSKADLAHAVEESIDRAIHKVVDHLGAMPDKSWLTNLEAMAFLGFSKSTLQRLRRSGQLPFSKLNGSIFYKRSDVVDLLERNRVTR